MKLARSAAFALLSIAAIVAFGWTAVVHVRACQPARATENWARAWRVGGAPWRNLSAFADEIRQVADAGSIVAFRAVPAEHAVAWRIAYLLPELEIRPVGIDSNLDNADYAAVLWGRWPREDLEPLRAHPLGAVYRVSVSTDRAPR